MRTISIVTNKSTSSKVKWVLGLIKDNHDAELTLGTTDKLVIGHGSESVLLSQQFYNDLSKGIYSHEHHMKDGPWISLPSGEIDYLSSIFYLVNSLQEYGSTDLDHYGRFKYENSLQKRWGVVTQNIVWDYIQAFCDKYEIDYSKEPVNKCFLTHDIDFIYSGWKAEGKWALSKGKLLTFAKVLWQKIKGKPLYDNVNNIVDREEAHDQVSTFFWITQQGKCSYSIKNSDYTMSDSRVQEQISYSSKKGANHGLHKSTLDSSFAEELSKLDQPLANRYHFLKFTLPQAYNDIEEAGLKIDTSLGFAEHYGYRNSYGLPFQPYNMKEERPYNFLEVPLHMMDGSFIYYMGLEQEQVYDEAAQWIDEVKDHTLITVLWHNNELTEYSFAEMSKCYDKLLQKISNKSIQSVSQNDLIEQYLKAG